MPVDAPVCVVETQEFLGGVSALMSEARRQQLVVYLAFNPEAGVVVPETGGLRKLRWRRQHQGKRGGVRIVYFYGGQAMPLFLLTAYSKTDRADLDANDRKRLRRLTSELKARFGRTNS